MKRILSMVLALMMILGMVPAVAAAEYAVVDKRIIQPLGDSLGKLHMVSHVCYSRRPA